MTGGVQERGDRRTNGAWTDNSYMCGDVTEVTASRLVTRSTL
jgi:hypothetical protein